MPTKIISKLNEVVTDDWIAVDANDNSFLGVQISQTNYGIEIYGIDFGVRGAAVDEGFLRTSCIISENFQLDASVASVIIRARMRQQIVRFFDLPTEQEKTRIHKFTQPITIPKGQSMSVMFNTFQNGGAIGGVATVFLQVRGRFLDDPNNTKTFYSQSR
jgi:hypothetical protein